MPNVRPDMDACEGVLDARPEYGRARLPNDEAESRGA